LESSSSSSSLSPCLLLLTREPLPLFPQQQQQQQQHSSHHQHGYRKVNLQDLVSHRYNQGGVDNTGNICVWDSEKTLTYVLYHHFEEYYCNRDGWNPMENYTHSIFNNNDSSHPMMEEETCLHILELGTGMAGLSAVALGLQLAALQQQQQQQIHPKKKKKIRITLTDGSPSGVYNNLINIYLMKQYYYYQQQQQQDDDDNDTTIQYHSFHDLDITSQLLLWTTDMDNPSPTSSTNDNDNTASSTSTTIPTTSTTLPTTTTTIPTIPTTTTIIPYPSHIVLISDCIHFQKFHAALIMTTLRNLIVGGMAIFCQPTRGDSLQNFCSLLNAVIVSSSSSSDNNNNNNNKTNTTSTGTNTQQSSLIHWEWWEPSILKQKHVEAMTNNHNNNNNEEEEEDDDDDTYNESLHRPKILVLTKLRELTITDQQIFIDTHQSIQEMKHNKKKKKK
jgi:hypothetical protein